ncbi:hypothetical protein [Arthrobacter sp. KBS0703]|nr:hypothetical protein [Arthrobacter sp. KBS0703]
MSTGQGLATTPPGAHACVHAQDQGVTVLILLGLVGSTLAGALAV